MVLHDMLPLNFSTYTLPSYIHICFHYTHLSVEYIIKESYGERSKVTNIKRELMNPESKTGRREDDDMTSSKPPRRVIRCSREVHITCFM